MALFWSVDASFIYFFLGCSAFCFFLGFINRPAPAPENEPDFQQFHREKKEVDDAIGSDLPDELKSILDNPRPQYPQPSLKKTDFARAMQKRALLIFTGIVLILFGAIFIANFSSGSDFDAEAFYEQGEGFYQQEQYDSANTYYNKALSVRKDFPEALTGCGNVLMMKNDNEGAIRLYDKALAINPDLEVAKYQRGLVLFYQTQYEQSIVEEKSLLDINPSYFEVMQVVGDDYYNQKQYDSALYWYDAAYANGIRNRFLCHLMGYLYQTKGNAEKAISLYKEALEYDDSVADIFIRLGELLPGEEGNIYRTKAAGLQPAKSN